MHSSWLAADASLINMHVQLAMLREGQAARGRVRDEADERCAELEARLAESEARNAEMEATVGEQNEEIDNLTMALQSAILDRKDIADQKLGKKK